MDDRTPLPRLRPPTHALLILRAGLRTGLFFGLFFGLLSGLFAGALQAAETPRQLAARHQCLGCHAVDEARAGPAFQQVADRYATTEGALPQLLKIVKAGSVGRWGSTPMPPEAVPEPDLTRILEWVLAQ
jgi:cytochrome c